jgi:biotin synthase
MHKEELKALLDLPLEDLIAQANRVRSEFAGRKIELCNILNAKSGKCAEDCKFCAQSSRHATGIDAYPLKSREEMFEAARHAKDIGALRFDIVTSGDSLKANELEVIIEAVSEITSKIGIKMCASLGTLKKEDLLALKKAGLTRYHHNIESSPRFFPKIVTSHTFQDRLDTIRAAKSVELEVCSGGIIGMGEDMNDRIEMALILKELNVDSVPINILVPIKGTPLESQPRITPEEAIRTIAIFRIILKDKIIKVAAGRESVLKEFQSQAFMAGANGMLIGGYLTIRGRSVEEDWKLVKEVESLWME